MAASLADGAARLRLKRRRRRMPLAVMLVT